MTKQSLPSLEELERAAEPILPYLVVGILHEPPPERPAVVACELEQGAKAVRHTLQVLDEFSSDTWERIGLLDGWNEPASRGDEWPTRGQLYVLLQAFEQEAATAKTERPGCRQPRRQDPRIFEFALALARIYQQITGRCPTHTADKDSGLPISLYNQFAMRAFKKYYPRKDPTSPDADIPWSVVREAMRAAVARLRSETTPQKSS